jgi:dihydroneopterin aldolase
MRFHVLVGILPHELTIPQPVEIDLAVSLTDGREIVDYSRLYEATAAILSGGHIEFLEEIADRVAAAALAASTRIASARVAVRKPRVALGGPLDYAEVRIERTRTASGV